ncbi:hypothetical protein GDO78_023166, partial [Eleutherodactylus coqui]
IDVSGERCVRRRRSGLLAVSVRSGVQRIQVSQRGLLPHAAVLRDPRLRHAQRLRPAVVHAAQEGEEPVTAGGGAPEQLKYLSNQVSASPGGVAPFTQAAADFGHVNKFPVSETPPCIRLYGGHSCVHTALGAPPAV